jgi:hypothetical protein
MVNRSQETVQETVERRILELRQEGLADCNIVEAIGTHGSELRIPMKVISIPNGS